MTLASKDEAAVRARLNTWADACRAMDIDAIMACYAPEAVSFDCHSVFRLKGLDSHRRHLEACFPYMVAPMTLELHELSVAAGGGVAFAHYAMQCGATGQDGQEHRSWMRGTICLREIDGRWLIVHDHCSAPFDPMTNTAMLDAGREYFEKVA